MIGFASCFTRLLVGAGLAGLCGAALAQDDCVRSVPAPLFVTPPPAVRAHDFSASANHEAEERFFFGRNVQVLVTHGGCEYYVTSYRFSAPSLFADGYSVQKAYAAAATQLRELARLHPATPSDLAAAANTLAAQARLHAPALERELAVDGDGFPPLQGQVKLDAAGRQGAIGFVQVTLFRGPL